MPAQGLTGKRWRLRGRFPEGALSDAPYPTLIRHLLWHRGVRTAAEAARFLDATTPTKYDPLLLPEMEQALSRLQQAVRQGETVAVFGDFDVDGVTASVLLTEGLRGLGARVVPYLPDRFREGYGLSVGALDTLNQQGARLLVTADCGTSSLPEIEYAGRLGMEVIVLDHHTVPPQLPSTVATVNPKRPESAYPDPELAAVGVAYKVMGALYESLGRPGEAQRYLDLVALGTVADLAPLQDENRWLVKQGLAALAQTQRPGLRALMETAGLRPSSVDAEAIAYTLAPRLNAAGRLAHARLAFDLLMEQKEEIAMQQAQELSALNQARQRQTEAALGMARELLAQEDPAAPLLFIGHPQISAGIVGLVAGRLAEERYRPAVVYEQGDLTSRASCRSIPEFDITVALRECAELLVRFGGHRAAAGFTAENAQLPALKAALLRQAEAKLAGINLTPAIDIDAAVPLHRLTGPFVQTLLSMAPFGQGNPEPTFLSRGVELVDIRAMGNHGQHLRLKIRDGRVTWPAVAFGLGPESPEELDIRPGQRLDIVYSFALDRVDQGGATGAGQAPSARSGQALELRVKDLALSR